MTEDEFRRALLRERFGPLPAERTRPIPKVEQRRNDEGAKAKRRRDLEVACRTKVPPLTYVEFRNNPAKAPWLSRQNRAEAG